MSAWKPPAASSLQLRAVRGNYMAWLCIVSKTKNQVDSRVDDPTVSEVNRIHRRSVVPDDTRDLVGGNVVTGSSNIDS